MTKAMPWSAESLTTEVAAMKNDTLKKLKAMRLPAFAETYQKQIDRKTNTAPCPSMNVSCYWSMRNMIPDITTIS